VGVAPAPGASPFTLTAAGNEYESFQVLCGSGPLVNVTMSVSLPSPLTSLLHAVAYYDAVNISDCNASPGRWPDPLIPAVDPWFSEVRNAFPFTIVAGTSRAAWVDVFVPHATPAGTYSGSVTVYSPTLAAAGGSLVLPLAVTVYNFSLPDVSPYATAFGYFGTPDLNASEAETTALSYLQLGLMHRVTLSNAFDYSPDFNTAGTLNWTRFEQVWGPYLTGAELPFGLADAAVTAVQLPVPFCSQFVNATPACVDAQVSYWAEVAAWFRARGLEGRLFDYTIDEPEYNGGWNELLARGAAVHAADPMLRVLCTVNMWQAAAHNATATIDLYVPIINEMDAVGSCADGIFGNSRLAYDNVTVSNLWWYQSCSSHGCSGGCAVGDSGVPCSTGWPSYMLDHPSVMNRAMAWLTYQYNMGGQLYWAVNYASSIPGGDAWTAQWFFGGNGDGTMTYRGLPSVIGGDTEIPVASQRLKHVRDGEEDLMYLTLAEAALGSRAAVLALASQVTANAYTYTDDPAVLLAVRGALAEVIQSATTGAGVAE
jgi:hypothetical protein